MHKEVGYAFPDSCNFCRLSITFANRLDLDQDRQNVGPDLDPKPFDTLRVSAGLKFASDILSEQPQYCSDIWNFLGHFFRHSFYHHKPKMLSALLIMKTGVVLLPFRMVGAA